MSRLVIQVANQEQFRATAIVEFGPGKPVQFGAANRVVSDVMKLERPLPLGALVRHVLASYGLAPANEAESAPVEAAEVVCRSSERGALPA